MGPVTVKVSGFPDGSVLLPVRERGSGRVDDFQIIYFIVGVSRLAIFRVGFRHGRGHTGLRFITDVTSSSHVLESP